jgi:hypothetical protein
MTAAHAHAFHGARPAQLPNTVEAIRKALPPAQREQFLTELGPAVDRGDLAEVDEIKGKWWAHAMWHHDPSIQADFEASARGELEFFASPFANR